MLTDGPTPEEAATIGEHAKCLERLLEEGVAILFGRTQTADENTFGIVIFASADEGSARAVMEADPAVRRGVMAAELLPYKVAGMRGG
jgi:uncharacterized protein YciI